MQSPRTWLVTAFTLCGAAFPMRPAGAEAGAAAVLRPSAAVYAAGYQENLDQYHAERMKDWMRLHRRRPEARDFARESYLRTWWDAFQREERRQKDREAERKKYEAALALRREEQARREYQKALNFYAEKNYREAITVLFNIRTNADYVAYHPDAEAKLKEIDQVGMQEIDVGRQLAGGGNYEEALKRYNTVLILYRRLPCAKAAGEAIAALRQDPAYLAAVKKERAGLLFKRAEQHDGLKEYAAAAALYETLVQGFSDTEEGRRAAARLEAMKADPEIAAILEQQRAAAERRNLMAQAESYITMGFGEKAVPRLQELVEKYPDSDEGKKAKALLSTLPAPAPEPAPATP